MEHGVEAPAVDPASQAIEAAAQPADPAGLDDREDEKQEDPDAEADNRRSDVGRDGGIQVDRSVLRWPGPGAPRAGRV
jgi:hypothetical protein